MLALAADETARRSRDSPSCAGPSADSLSLPLMLKIVERVREREGSEPARVREQWRMARAAAHVALASRESAGGLRFARIARNGEGLLAGGVPRGHDSGWRRDLPRGDCRCAREVEGFLVAAASGRRIHGHRQAREIDATPRGLEEDQSGGRGGSTRWLMADGLWLWSMVEPFAIAIQPLAISHD